jgi:hypothetical protein
VDRAAESTLFQVKVWAGDGVEAEPWRENTLPGPRFYRLIDGHLLPNGSGDVLAEVLLTAAAAAVRLRTEPAEPVEQAVTSASLRHHFGTVASSWRRSRDGDAAGSPQVRPTQT